MECHGTGQGQLTKPAKTTCLAPTVPARTIPTMHPPWAIALLLVMGLIFLGLVGYLFFQVGRVLWRLPGEIRGRREEAATDARRREALRQLPLAEAMRMADEVIASRAQATAWESEPSSDIAARIAPLDPDLAALLRRHRALRFALSSTEVSADHLGADEVPDGMRSIGLTGEDGSELGRRLLCAEPGLPVIHEVISWDIYGNGRRVLETYPSLHHYLLLVEAPDRLVAATEAPPKES